MDIGFEAIKPKSYADFLGEISSDDLFRGLLGEGLFDNKLPPMFSSKSFCEFCTVASWSPSRKEAFEYVSYRCVRNADGVRMMGVPHPVAYYLLCKSLSDNWTNIVDRLKENTVGQSHKVSQIHLRKQRGSDRLFEMNYGSWNEDGDPIPEIQVADRYQVTTDITQCFPSIYSHAVCWALVGKAEAKKTKGKDSVWYNKIDKALRNCTNGETHGVLIGPHASNLISEIILTAVDKVLVDSGFRYVRNVDDYRCFAKSFDEAEEFIRILDLELHKYGFLRNQKKTNISVLPVPTEVEWPRALKSFPMPKEGRLERGHILAFLDYAVDLVLSNGNNAAVLNYALKMLVGRQLTKPAVDVLLSRAFQFARLYPYLCPIMDEVVFSPFQANGQDIERLANDLYDYAKSNKTWFPAYYAFYYALKYGFHLASAKVDEVIESGDCILKVLELVYAKENKNSSAIKKLKEDARSLMNSGELSSNWLFVYEALSAADLKDELAAMKKAKVSFILPISDLRDI